MLHRKIAILVMCIAAHAAAADLTITAPDGRKILLRDDGTWAVIQDGADGEPRRYAALTLEKKADLATGCRLGLRMQNNLTEQIRSLVLRFTAFKEAQIPFETVSRGYSYIKPTASQYQEITFRGIQCEEISLVEVVAARNCHVGDLTKYSAEAHHCLNLIDVVSSDIVTIAKGTASR